MSTKPPQELVLASSIINEAAKLQVSSPKEATLATEVLSRANIALDRLTIKENERTFHLKEQLELEKSPFMAPKKALKEIIQDLRQKLSTYQTEETKRAQIEQQKIADRAQVGNLRPETAIRKLNEIDTPTERIYADSGKLSFRPKPTLKIVDESLIPREYMTPNGPIIFEALQDGKKIPGAEIEVVQIPINRR